MERKDIDLSGEIMVSQMKEALHTLYESDVHQKAYGKNGVYSTIVRLLEESVKEHQSMIVVNEVVSSLKGIMSTDSTELILSVKIMGRPNADQIINCIINPN